MFPKTITNVMNRCLSKPSRQQSAIDSSIMSVASAPTKNWRVIYVVLLLVGFHYELLSLKALAALIILIVIWLALLRTDCDLVLLYYDYFGKSPESMKDKVVWITGASSGIGESIALSLAESNCRLILSARSQNRLVTVKKRCLENSDLADRDVLVLPFDMLDYSRHEPAFSTALKHFGRIDVLVSNAGRTQRARWEMIDVAVDKELFELNLFSLLSLARIVTRYFVSVGKGHHVVTSSIAGKCGFPMSASYTGSKHALQGYFEGLRAERGGKGIDVSLLYPGPVESNLMEGVIKENTDQGVGIESRVGRLMSAERCAHLATVAIANRLSECWICQQPLLSIFYLSQYFPTLVKSLQRKMNFSAIIMYLRDGRTSEAEKED